MNRPDAAVAGADADAAVGIVREWNERGYAWIETPPALTCWFAHVADVIGRVKLRPGQRVRFVPVRTARGPRAVAVELIEPAPRRA